MLELISISLEGIGVDVNVEIIGSLPICDINDSRYSFTTENCKKNIAT